MCFPNTLSTCSARALAMHELTHADQDCRVSNNATRFQRERAGYKKQCESIQRQMCVDPNSTEGKKAVNDCIASRINQSTNPINVEKFKEACTNVIIPEAEEIRKSLESKK